MHRKLQTLPELVDSGYPDTNRWAPVVSVWLVNVLSQIDRGVLALLVPFILAETHMSAQSYGLTITAFSIVYIFACPVWGHILDRVGNRRGLTIAVTLWSLASMAHAAASGFWGFASARAALASGEGAAFPAGLRAVTASLMPASRGRGLALILSGGIMGSILTPLVMLPVYQHFGWHAVFLLTGAMGAVWITIWHFAGPRLEPPAGLTRLSAAPFRHPTVWALFAVYAFGTVPMILLSNYASLYLKTRFDLHAGDLAYRLPVAVIAAEIGYLFWGFLLDKVGPRHGRLLPAALVLSFTIAFTDSIPGVWWVLLGFSIGLFGQVGLSVLSISYALRHFPGGRSGVLTGAAIASQTAIAGLTSPVFGRMFDQRQFATVFHAAAAFPVAAYLIWLWISTRLPRTA